MIIKLKLSTDKRTEDSQAVMSNTGILCNLWTPWSSIRWHYWPIVQLTCWLIMVHSWLWYQLTVGRHVNRYVSLHSTYMTASLNRQVSYSRRPWDEHDCKASAGQLLCKNKNKQIGNLLLSHWKMIEILKIVTFQNLNFISKSKEYLLQTTKLWEKLIVYLTEERIRRWTQKKK